MKHKNPFATKACVLFSLLFLGSSALAAPQIGDIVIRPKGGVALYSGLGSASAAGLVGLDLGTEFDMGLGLGFTGYLAFNSSAGSGLAYGTYLIGFNPNYNFKKGTVNISLGLILGSLAAKAVTSSANGDVNTTASSFALGGNATVDIPIHDFFGFNLGMQFITTAGRDGGNITATNFLGGFTFRL